MKHEIVIATMIGKKEEDCSPSETVCPTCKGSTIGDFGQPFECETCQGSGVIPVFDTTSRIPTTSNKNTIQENIIRAKATLYRFLLEKTDDTLTDKEADLMYLLSQDGDIQQILAQNGATPYVKGL